MGRAATVVPGVLVMVYSPPDRGAGSPSPPARGRRAGDPGRAPSGGGARRLPDPDHDNDADTSDTDGEDEVGLERAGRQMAQDQGSGKDEDAELWATDAGIDGAGASAEEAAMHVIDDDDDAAVDD
jgi:hypothetical protein